MAGSTGGNSMQVLPKDTVKADGRTPLQMLNEMSKSVRSLPSSEGWLASSTREPSFSITSSASSAMTSASTTPHLESSEKLPNYSTAFSSNTLEEQNNFYNEGTIRDGQYHDYDEYDETDNTVIHHDHDKFNSNERLNINNNNNNMTDIMEGHTKRSITIDEMVDNYLHSLKQSEIELNNEIHLTFEEFKFDIITDHLSLPVESVYNRTLSNANITKSELINNHTGYFEESINGLGENMVIRLSDTPYLVLLHSTRPKLMSFSILSFLRRNITTMDKRLLISLMTLSISIFNMTENSNRGLKLYSKMLIFRTKKLLSSLLYLEKYLLKFSTNKYTHKRNNISNNSKKTKLNLITSSIHLLISVFVKRIGKMISYVSNIGSLWKYIAVYGLDGDFDELKIVRNIIENPSSCSCTWLNEPARLIKALQYVRKVLLCIIMSSMEVEEIEETDDKKARICMKNFWSKFGFENIKWNAGSLTFATKLLGMCTCLDEFITFIETVKNEIIDDKLMNNEHLESEHEFYDLLNNSESRLDIVNERNEDERIRNLSSIVGKISYKLDLIELGVGQEEDGLTTLKSDIDELMNRYNEVTSGKSNTTRRNTNKDLKKIRMSELLFDEFNDDELTKKANRRSSGINIKLFSVVKDENEREETEGDEAIDESLVSEKVEQPHGNPEFRKTLESLCLKTNNSNSNSNTNSRITSMIRVKSTGKENESIKNKIDEAAFIEFKQELKQRLESERLN